MQEQLISEMMATNPRERPQASEAKSRLERIAEMGGGESAVTVEEESMGEDLTRLFSEDLDVVWEDVRMKVENN